MFILLYYINISGRPIKRLTTVTTIEAVNISGFEVIRKFSVDQKECYYLPCL